MLFKNDSSGVVLIEIDNSVSDDFKIGYHIGKIYKESTINYSDLPKYLQDDFSKVTNMIARWIENGDDIEEYKFLDGSGGVIGKFGSKDY